MLVSGLSLGLIFVGLLRADRDLSRFDDVSGSMRRLLAVLALSWTFAAIRDEVAFRAVLQAADFGFAHVYREPAALAHGINNTIGLLIVYRGVAWCSVGAILAFCRVRDIIVSQAGPRRTEAGPVFVSPEMTGRNHGKRR